MRCKSQPSTNFVYSNLIGTFQYVPKKVFDKIYKTILLAIS